MDKWNDSVLAVGKKIDANLDAGLTGEVRVEAETKAHLAVVPNLVAASSENEAKISAEPGQPQRQSILRRQPKGLEGRRKNPDERDPR